MPKKSSKIHTEFYISLNIITLSNPSVASSRHHPFHRPAASGVTLDLSFGDVQNNESPVAVPPRPPIRRPDTVHFELSLTLIIFARSNQCQKLC